MPTFRSDDRPVLVLHTGGTIGMRSGPRGLEPSPDFAAVLAARLAPVADRLPRFEIAALDRPIDSADASPADWAAIATRLVERRRDFAGAVVLHGTDTLAFTAAALSFMLGDLDGPVILTGAQRPMDTAGSDGFGNVVSALRFAARPEIREVGIAFDGLLLRGNRTTKVSTSRLDGFGSPNLAPLGRLGPGGPVEAGLEFAPPSRATAARGVEIPWTPAGAVISLRLVPGFPPGLLDGCLALSPAGIVLECYGAGTVPALGGRMLEFLGRAAARDIVVVALSQVAHGGLSLGTYAAGSALVEAGVVDGRDMTFEAAYAKIAHLIGSGRSPEEIRRLLPRSLAGELTEPA